MASRYLSKGGKIGVASLCSPIDREEFDRGCAELESRGYSLEIPIDPAAAVGLKDYAFSCATTKQRVDCLADLYRNPEVEVILAVRGGYGSLELLEDFDFSVAVASPKPLIGFSDITAILAVLAFHHSLPAVHGASLKTFGKNASDLATFESRDLLIEYLAGSFAPSYEIEAIRDGDATGELIVGNLTLLRSLLGTPWDFSYDGKILVLEEVNDVPFRILRSLMQLKLAGKFNNLAGLVFGDMGNFVGNGLSTDETLLYFIDHQLASTSYPISWRLPVGHGDRNLPLPLGVKAEIKDSKLTVLE